MNICFWKKFHKDLYKGTSALHGLTVTVLMPSNTCRLLPGWAFLKIYFRLFSKYSGVFNPNLEWSKVLSFWQALWSAVIEHVWSVTTRDPHTKSKVIGEKIAIGSKKHVRTMSCRKNKHNKTHLKCPCSVLSQDKWSKSVLFSECITSEERIDAVHLRWVGSVTMQVWITKERIFGFWWRLLFLKIENERFHDPRVYFGVHDMRRTNASMRGIYDTVGWIHY